MTTPPGGGAALADRRARAWLTRAAEPGQAAVHALVQHVGPADTVRLIRNRQAPPSVQAAVGSRCRTGSTRTWGWPAASGSGS